MLFTEEEAKTKDCPFGALRVLACAATGESPTSWNRWVKCDASGCMMWRGESVDAGEGRYDYVNTEGYARKYTGRGYCGLAGRPE